MRREEGGEGGGVGEEGWGWRGGWVGKEGWGWRDG